MFVWRDDLTLAGQGVEADGWVTFADQTVGLILLEGVYGLVVVALRKVCWQDAGTVGGVVNVIEQGEATSTLHALTGTVVLDAIGIRQMGGWVLDAHIIRIILSKGFLVQGVTLLA